MATSRDVREVIAKLSSDKAKSREEGVRLLSTWLESERSIEFCRLLGRNTVKIKPGEIPGAETWPFLITLLTKCVALEISASKKRPPKIMLAKALRAAVQCAEDSKLSGKPLLLLSVAKLLFNHIWDVVKDVPSFHSEYTSFHSEYTSILRRLLTIKEYRYEMRKRIYCGLVILYMNKVVIGLDSKINSQTSSKEEVFRYVLTLYALLANPPGDFPGNLREDVVKRFSTIFALVRDDGMVSLKLMECINTYLLKYEPNLGCRVMEVHSAVQEFMFHCWQTTRSRGMKNLFIIYSRVLLKLSWGTLEGSRFVEKLLYVIIKELDRNISSGVAFLRTEIPRDEKAGSLGSIQEGFMELAAAVLYQACKNKVKMPYKGKRFHAADLIKDGISKDSWLWFGVVYFLIHNYGFRVEKALVVILFEATCNSLKRILNNTNAVQFQDALVWLLRALQEFSSVFLAHNSKEPSRCISLTLSEISLLRNFWQDIWSSLMHGLLIFSSANSVVHLALILLGNMILRDQIGVAFVPQEVWDLRIFKHMRSSSTLYFIACYFSRAGFQGRALMSLLANLTPDLWTSWAEVKRMVCVGATM